MLDRFRGRVIDEVPFVTGNVVADVDLGLVFIKIYVEFEPVVRPGAELHLTVLYVEREVCDVYRTARHVDRRRNPEHLAVTADDYHGVPLLLQPLVGTARHSLHTYHYRLRRRHRHHISTSSLVSKGNLKFNLLE